MGGALPASTAMASGAVMSGGTLPNGGYVGMQQQAVVAANQGQNPYSVQQGQWSMNQVNTKLITR